MTPAQAPATPTSSSSTMSDPPRDSPPPAPPDETAASRGSDPLPRSALDSLRADPEVQRAMAELDGEKDADRNMWKVDPARPAPASEHQQHVEVKLGKRTASDRPAESAEPKVVVVDPAIDPAEYRRLPEGDRRAATVVSLQKVASAPRSITGTAQLVTPAEVRAQRSGDNPAERELTIDLEARTLGGGTQRGLLSPARRTQLAAGGAPDAQDSEPPLSGTSTPVESDELSASLARSSRPPAAASRRTLVAVLVAALAALVAAALLIGNGGSTDQRPAPSSAAADGPTVALTAAATLTASASDRTEASAQPSSSTAPLASSRASADPSTASARPSAGRIPAPPPSLPSPAPAKSQDPFGELP